MLHSPGDHFILWYCGFGDLVLENYFIRQDPSITVLHISSEMTAARTLCFAAATFLHNMSALFHMHGISWPFSYGLSYLGVDKLQDVVDRLMLGVKTEASYEQNIVLLRNDILPLES